MYICTNIHINEPDANQNRNVETTIHHLPEFPIFAAAPPVKFFTPRRPCCNNASQIYNAAFSRRVSFRLLFDIPQQLRYAS